DRAAAGRRRSSAARTIRRRRPATRGGGCRATTSAVPSTRPAPKRFAPRLPEPGLAPISAFARKQRLQVGERIGPGRDRRVLCGQCTDSGVVDLAGVLVVVTVHAQQLPVAAVGRIVVVVVIAVVDRQLLEVGAGEISRAAAAGPWIHLQGTLPIALRALFGAATGLGDDAVE